MAQAARRARGAGLGDKGYRLATVDDLTGGIDQRRSQSLLQPNRARILRNVSLQEPGAWQPFPGWRTHSTTSLGALTIQGARRIYLATSTFLLAGYNGSVYKPSDAGVWGAAVLTGRSTANDHFFVYDRTLVALFDGAASPKKSTDGTTWTEFGITAPVAASVSANLAGGTLVSGNVYEISYTYGSSSLAFESNGAPVDTHTPSAGNLSIRNTIPRSTDPQVDTIYVYLRDVTSGESILRRAGSVANPAVGSATFDVTSNTWFPDGLEIPTRHNVPQAMSFGVVWRNRWWGRDATVKNRIRFTEVFLPQAWPELYYLDIPFDRGDEITAMATLGDVLVVFGNTDVFLIIGQTSLDFEVRPSAGAVAGALGPRAVDVIEQGVIHAAPDGAYIFDGASDRLLSDDASVTWNDMMDNAAPAELAKIAVVYHYPRKEVRVTLPRLYDTAAPGELVLDLSRTREQETEAWTTTTRSIAGYVLWDGKEAITGDQGRLLSWKRGAGQLAEESVGLAADGADQVCVYEGPALLPAPRRVVRFVDFFGEFRPAAGSFTVGIKVDDVEVASLSVAIGSTLSLYGTGTYGSAIYGGRLRRNFVSDLPETAEGLTAIVTATYTGQELFKWYTYAFGVRPEPLPRGIQ